MSSTPAPSQQRSEGKSPYRKTLNLPSTPFPMRANLVQNEPASVKRWNKASIYDRVCEARKGRDKFVFHDGPPYANGSIHLGHVLNKCLKDFVVRSKLMSGLDCTFIPGWDCHGLPIEHKVMLELIEKGKMAKLDTLEEDARRLAIRRTCHEAATKAQKLQAGQLERLLTIGDYDHPYLTMLPEYETAVLEVLATLIEQGIVYRDLKPVHWSIANETALADAELEYENRTDPSVYVDFETAKPAEVYQAFGLDEDTRPGETPSLMIWTTTPWTLPANLAIAVHERITYALVRVDGNVTVIAEDRVSDVCKAAKAEDVEVLATAPGAALVGLKYRHPFIEIPNAKGDLSKAWSVVSAEYVTIEDGTGLVHTAPGHGTEDYQTGLRIGLPIYCPVLANGTYDDSAPEWLRGKEVFSANPEVVQTLRSSGHLFHHHEFEHSYPHDWRSKTPVIFRCTEQWFVSVDTPTNRDGTSLRKMATDCLRLDVTDALKLQQLQLERERVVAGPGSLVEEELGPATLEMTAEQIDEEIRQLTRKMDLQKQRQLSFVPEWGRNRLRGMLESRPDWCISRQRAWGLPIPAFYTETGETLMTAASVRAVAEVVAKEGSDAWFTKSPADLLANYDFENDPDCPPSVASSLRDSVASLTKGGDTLDVWFESGSSWNAVMRSRSDGKDFPVDLYLEGSDQHRGWFQTSLLCSLGMMGEPAYRKVLTHGFMVDKDGRKLSKSKGDTVEDLYKKYGADVLRWWVCSLSYENDIKTDAEFFELAGESYRKIRNTLRFMLSNLGDFEVQGADCPMPDIAPTSVDAWVLGEYDKTAKKVTDAYHALDYRTAHAALYHFCNETLSAIYLACVKDRLYCDPADGPRRRQTQAVLWNLTDGLCRLLAPILCHTADEAYRALVGTSDDDACVHVLEFRQSLGITPDPAWPDVMARRRAALLALEAARAAGGDDPLENPLDAGVILPDEDNLLARFDIRDLADLLGVSEIRLDPAEKTPTVEDLRSRERCERSWKRDGTVQKRSDGGMLSDRDAEALGLT